MITPIESGSNIELTGKSGERYTGKIYADKNSTSDITGASIACLSNSTLEEGGWTHRVNSIYNTNSATDELKQFQNRDDISHLILLPHNENENGVQDKVDDLIRSYLHR
jgi:hypothetical protein